MSSNLNGKTCICYGRHQAPGYNKDVQSVPFVVYYPPTTPTVEISGTSFPWVENTQGVVRCTTTSGNPPEVTYNWLQNSQVIYGQTTDTYTIPTLTNVHNGLRIQCRVSNLYTRNRPPAKVSNITVLDVKYTLDITVQEGDNPSRQCSAIGNPTPTVNWYRGTSAQTFGIGTSATLVFSNIDRNQADTYQCKATATEKKYFESSKSVSVVVYYPPAVTVTLQNTTENDINIVFTCNASHGFPTNYTYHGWTQYLGNTLVRSYTDFTGMLSDSNRKLTIHKVTFADIGRYYCDVENRFHGRKPDVLQQGSSYFDVRAAAKFDPDEKGSNLGELHKSVIINIKFYSNPPAVISDIKWINESSGNLLTNSDSISLNLLSTQIQRNVYGKTVTLTGQSAILTIASLQTFHLGHYKLQIKNGGNLSSSYNFQIIHEESESSKYYTTSAVIGGAIGSIMTLIVIVAIINLVIWYRRITNRGKHNDISNDDVQINNTYADLDKELAMSEVSPYQAIKNTDGASTDINTYEGLGGTKQESGANMYETLTNKRTYN